MMPIKTFVSERRATNLLAQIRWRDGVYCPRCRAESVIRYGSHRLFQRYRCKDCDRTFNDQTGTFFEHSAVALRKWFLAVYTVIRFNTSLRHLDGELDVSYKTVYRRVQRFLRALDAPQPQLEGPVEIDELYVKAGLKGRARVASPRVDQERTLRTSPPCSSSSVVGVAAATCSLRKPPTNRRFDSCGPTASKSY